MKTLTTGQPNWSTYAEWAEWTDNTPIGVLKYICELEASLAKAEKELADSKCVLENVRYRAAHEGRLLRELSKQVTEFREAGIKSPRKQAYDWSHIEAIQVALKEIEFDGY